MQPAKPDNTVLIDVLQTKMPFGKYKGTLIADLPVYYLEWLQKNGMPPGKLGMLLSTTYEIKINGMTTLLNQLKAALKGHQQPGTTTTIPKIT
ncbi:DUF3820 family protein [Mucilaginibacter sp. KACC 22063]|uniref:DUF3820 family protein n=1 Tax=Mucilaginibacter sp. KACC 22063 TaxID=3025666 RepID=UPI0023651B74|nr:DUF3820 family protein [Mucilaginibacter sp. KACC 22063]WDF53493.1 DUF3820 family protein [Mucilaginibacter sp. KACC 22063]